MFIRPELRKGDIDVRVKAPKDLVDKVDLISLALGLTRQDIVLVALDAYLTETLAVARVLGQVKEPQRNPSGIATAGDAR